MRLIQRLSSALVVMLSTAVVATMSAQNTQAPPSQAPPAKAIDITGQWTSSFDTQIGAQTYTYDFVAKDGKLTGKVKGNLAEAPVEITDGTVQGDVVKFVEIFNFQGMDIRISYTGKIKSADEIAFTRNVADFATEELTAKRVKK